MVNTPDCEAIDKVLTSFAYTVLMQFKGVYNNNSVEVEFNK
jgi:hypothetical protein